MGEVRLLTYRLEGAPTPESVEKALHFARDMGAETVVVPAGTPLEGLDAIADRAGVNLAVMADTARPAALLKALTGKSKRLGVGVDTGLWAQEGVAPADGLALVKERLLYLRLRDRSARGPGGRDVLLGEGTGDLKALFLEMERLRIRPVSMTLDTAGVVKAPGDLFKAVDAFEAVVQPAYGINFTAFSKTRPIRWDVVMPAKGETPNPDALRKAGDEVRAKIVAAIPKQAYAAPKKRRKLLVIESLHGMSHNTIPHTNVMIAGDGQHHGRVGSRVQQRPRQSQVSEDQGVRRRVPEQHRRRAPGRTRCARRPRAIRQGRGRTWRHPWHAVGVAQLGRVRRDDRGTERATPDRAGRDEGLRSGEPAHEAVCGQGSRPSARSTTASSTKAGVGCDGTACASF